MKYMYDSGLCLITDNWTSCINHSIYNYTTGSIEFNELYPVIERAINYSCLKMNCIKLIKPSGSFSKINYETKAIYLLKNEQSLQ